MKQLNGKLWVFKGILFLLMFSGFNLNAQELVQVINEVITVNSTSSLLGYTRNKVQVRLPEKTKSYIYRISVYPKGNAGIDQSLLELLKKVGGAEVALMSSLSDFAIRNNDNLSIDAFIFNNVYDMDNFYSKNENNWSACKTMLNRANSCISVKECLNKDVFFGFRNNNISQGLDVKLEIIALVDSTSTVDYLHSFTINNNSNQELKYFLSPDNINWKEMVLRKGYINSFNIEQEKLFFKIYTDKYKFSSYRLDPSERYKIIWNSSKMIWDLVKY